MAVLLDDAGSQALIAPLPLGLGNAWKRLVYGMSFSCWAQSDVTNINQTALYLGLASTFNNYLELRWTSGAALNFRARNGGGASNCSSIATFSANTWSHCFGRKAAPLLDGNDRHSIIDADIANKGASGTVRTPDFDVVGIGVHQDDTPDSYFSGQVCECAVWARVLWDGEVRALGLGWSPLFFPHGLIFYAPLYKMENFDVIGGLKLQVQNGPLTYTAHPSEIKYPAGFIPGMAYRVDPFNVHRRVFAVTAAPPAGNAMPMAMDHYRRRRTG